MVATCKLGEKGCWNDGKCRLKPCSCENQVVTNADLIRAMSDVELEEFIRRTSVGYEPWCDHHCTMNGDDNCNSCLAKWLREPAEGE